MTSYKAVRRLNARGEALPVARTLARIERVLMRYGLVLILLWIGAVKFTAYEANGIRGLEANSPLLKPFLAATGTFLTPLTFIFTTPGWESSLGGFPALSAGVGQFLLKDVILLGAAVTLSGKA